MLCRCRNKFKLYEIDTRFGRITKKYSCPNGHKRDILRDVGLIEITDFIGPVRSKQKIIIDEDDYKTNRLSGRRYK